MKRFYKAAGVGETEGGFRVELDGRPVRSPAKAPLVFPSRPLAQGVADEWAAQGEFLVPGAMPATRLASTAIDRVSQTREPVAAEIAAYAGSDVICYLAEHPTALIERQQAFAAAALSGPAIVPAAPPSRLPSPPPPSPARRAMTAPCATCRAPPP